MNLLIDIGNSRIKWARHSGTELLSTGACVYEKAYPLKSFESAIQTLPVPEQIFIANVAGATIASELASAVEKFWSLDCHFLQVSRHAAGVTNAYADVTQMGVDRWLAMIAAWNTCQEAVCVVDCGTAVTVDIVAASGQHEGGYIIPGITMMGDVLGNRTQQISYSQTGNLSCQPGRTTVECINNGALLAITALVEAAVKYVKREHGNDSRCIITGGYGEEIQQQLSISSDCDPHLVLKGMTKLIGNS